MQTNPSLTHRQPRYKVLSRTVGMGRREWELGWIHSLTTHQCNLLQIPLFKTATGQQAFI